MDYLVKIRSVQTPLNGQFSIGANRRVLNELMNAVLAWGYSPMNPKNG